MRFYLVSVQDNEILSGRYTVIPVIIAPGIYLIPKCDAYWRAALKRGRGLYLSKKNCSNEISKRNFLFPNNNK